MVEIAVRRVVPALLIGSALTLSGCAPQLWAKPGGTETEFEGTKAACNSQSYQQFPPMMQQVMTMQGHTNPMQTSCNGTGSFVNCYTTGGDYVPPVYMPVDQNQGARNSAVRSCLMNAGWVPVKNREEAAQIANSTPLTGTQATVSPISTQSGSNAWQTRWDAIRAECTTDANRSNLPFSNAFHHCMEAHGL